MRVRKNPFAVVLVVGFTTLACGAASKPGGDILWRDPGDITARDLFYGPGGQQDQPHGPYTFVKEDLDGSNPKFVIKDRDGIKWKVKLGVEARPETVATRLVWAIGYSANEDYFLPELQIDQMPGHLHRGQKLVSKDGSVHNVRLKREDDKKTGTWEWRHDPFTGTREWNGLRVMMAVLNNWDLKDINNAIYPDGDSHKVYLVSDLGASFGTTSASWPLSKAKGNLKSYQHSGFIRRSDATTVDFYVPGRPQVFYLVHPHDYFLHLSLRWIGKDIPRADARWIGDLLAHLSNRQIQDAFRAAGYSPKEIDGFSSVVARRIASLSEL